MQKCVTIASASCTQGEEIDIQIDSLTTTEKKKHYKTFGLKKKKKQQDIQTYS